MSGLQFVWVAAAIPAFVVIVGDDQGLFQVVNRRQHLKRILRMLAHDDPLFIGERPWFLQDLIRDADLADIV